MPDIVIVFGSESDLPDVRKGGMAEILDAVGVSHEAAVVSAHRNLDELISYCRERVANGTRIFIGIAGMAAVLPSIIAGMTNMRTPVIGVPLPVGVFHGIDALLSMISVPSGVPVLVPGVGTPGLRNAAIAACQILAVGNPGVAERLDTYLRETARVTQIPIDIHQPPEGRTL